MRNTMPGTARSPGAGRWLILIAAIVAALTAAYGYNLAAPDTDRIADRVNTSDVAALDRATQQNPENVRLWKQLAQAQRRAGNTTAAITALVRAARLDPDDVEISAALRDLSQTNR
ncbi:MAG: tetratricopeptide repeat protein [Minwuia sp.]|nr:tetratricopeptide repeat protein [Minwuia sp.]